MIRFIMQLLGKPYEPCKTCQVLKEQLEYERSMQREMFQAFNDFVKPKPVQITGGQSLMPVARNFVLPSKHRAELERVDRERARMEVNSIHLAKPDERPKPTVPVEAIDDIDKLEKELGIEDTQEVENASRISNSNG